MGSFQSIDGALQSQERGSINERAEMKQLRHLISVINTIFVVVDVLIWHHTNVHYYVIHFD